MKWHGAAVVRLGLLLVLAACAGARRPDTPAPTPTISGLISQEAAINAALRIAMSSHPEISASRVLPREIVATQMTLAQAEQAVHGRDSAVPAGYAPDLPVWGVTMEGWWLDEFPQPTDSPTPEPYRQMTVILDAATGLEIETQYQP